AHGRNQPEHDAANRRAGMGLDVVADLVDLTDDAGGAREQQPTGLGQHHAPAVPGEQLCAQLMLQKLDLAAECGLRYPQGIGRLGEAAELGHATEGLELAEIHTCQSWNATS